MAAQVQFGSVRSGHKLPAHDSTYFEFFIYLISAIWAICASFLQLLTRHHVSSNVQTRLDSDSAGLHWTLDTSRSIQLALLTFNLGLNGTKQPTNQRVDCGSHFSFLKNDYFQVVCVSECVLGFGF